jgi:hypothetical protein
MLFNYSSENFYQLRRNLIDYLNTHTDERLKGLIKTFLEILENDDYIEKLKRIDSFYLKFNNWQNPNDALNSNLLSNANVVLFNVYNKEVDNRFSIQDVIDSLFLVLYADFYEAEFLMTEAENQTNSFLSKYLSEMDYNADLLSIDASKRLRHLWAFIPKSVFENYFKNYVNEDTLKAVRELKENENFIKAQISANNSLKSDIETIRSELAEQKSEFNFIGLSNGFKSLKEQKIKELNGERWVYWILMLSIIGLIICKLYWTVNYLNEPNPNLQLLIVVSISFVLMLLVVIYFFRISLVNIKSIRSQILQIDLRLTLCQFIHNYQNDTSGFRNAEIKDSLDKFEAVIFSPIVATDDKIPTTFEGIEQLSGLIGLVKGKTP